MLDAGGISNDRRIKAARPAFMGPARPRRTPTDSNVHPAIGTDRDVACGVVLLLREVVRDHGVLGQVDLQGGWRAHVP